MSRPQNTHRAMPSPAPGSPVSPTAYLRNPYRLQRIRERGGEKAVRREMEVIRDMEPRPSAS